MRANGARHVYDFQAVRREAGHRERRRARKSKILEARAGSLRLREPSKAAWRLRVQVAQALAASAAIGVSITVDLLQSIAAGIWLYGLDTLGIAVLVFAAALWSERVVWPRMARRSTDPGVPLHVKTATQRRYSVMLRVTSGNEEFDLAVSGPPRRIREALRLAGEGEPANGNPPTQSLTDAEAGGDGWR